MVALTSFRVQKCHWGPELSSCHTLIGFDSRGLRKGIRRFLRAKRAAYHPHTLEGVHPRHLHGFHLCRSQVWSKELRALPESGREGYRPAQKNIRRSTPGRGSGTSETLITLAIAKKVCERFSRIGVAGQACRRPRSRPLAHSVVKK